MKKKTNHTLNDELWPEYAFASIMRNIAHEWLAGEPMYL